MINRKAQFQCIVAIAALLFTSCADENSETAGLREKSRQQSEKKAKSVRKKTTSKGKKSHTKKSSRDSKTKRPNIVVFLVDTLRSDHLSCYGYSRNTSPNIDALAERGARFEHVVSQAPWTPSSFASLMTSRYPSQIGVAAAVDEWGMARGGSVSVSEFGLP